LQFVFLFVKIYGVINLKTEGNGGKPQRIFILLGRTIFQSCEEKERDRSVYY